ncbi:hypothetical protein EUTSA_v10003433mg [Eutrema salsugineum]|uniref:Uncharacterized protein n=2 Tax=Eutrema salsugineum TaxID=72664 RepID=V4NER9_EUTSA|nr:inactive protein RESTRICTED TEV MOVEMENT 2 isoform X2 [Eutrema salsugineum]XP_024013124.1 inactive protein RESTRICTED TEV MOVEMENT 2 isoform X2 [Eutrema salsugineum]XP_024013125.1 inactive protein RESTRICTED TEV MOVEMENT 2 isoform X2 [Eutrema salsugineum]ESQ44566.1 hypothetical protein EUTSA_v10003433mg [Eutrema salsugineum]
MSNFIKKLEAAQGQQDPKAIMNKHFKDVKEKMKKKARGKQRARDDAAEKAKLEEEKSEKASQRAALVASPTVEENLEALRKTREKSQEVEKKLKEEKSMDLKIAKAKEDRQKKRVVSGNRLKGCKIDGESIRGHKGGNRST